VRPLERIPRIGRPALRMPFGVCSLHDDLKPSAENGNMDTDSDMQNAEDENVDDLRLSQALG
jgi:hypothetical protein